MSTSENSDCSGPLSHKRLVIRAGSVGTGSAFTSDRERPSNVCQTCHKVIQQLKQERKQLRAELVAQSIDASKTAQPCRCKFRENLELIQQEEKCLLEMIEFKKDRIQCLKESADLSLVFDLDDFKQTLNSKMLSYSNDLNDIIQSVDKGFSDQCKILKAKQLQVKKLQLAVDRLEAATQDLLRERHSLQVGLKTIEKEISNLKYEHQMKQEELEQQKISISSLEQISTQLNDTIAQLKQNIKMQIECEQIHKKEAVKRAYELEALCKEKEQLTELITRANSNLQDHKQVLAAQNELRENVITHTAETRDEIKSLKQKMEQLNVTKLDVKKELQENDKATQVLLLAIKEGNEKLVYYESLVEKLKCARADVSQRLLQILREDKSQIRSIFEEIQTYAVYLRSNSGDALM